MERKGKVHLVGAGPGDIGLLTIKGKKLLEECETIIYDRLVSPNMLTFVNEEAHHIYVGKIVGKHAINQDEINRIIVEEALKGKNVVRLKGGDPFVFGRGGEEIQELIKNEIPFEVVPGITSAIAVPEYAGIPVTHRGVSTSFHVVTGHRYENENGDYSDLEEELKVLAKVKGTLIFLMGIGNIKFIVDTLMANGKPSNTPIAIIEKGTTINQRVTKAELMNIVDIAKEREVKAPAIMIIGDVVNLNFIDDKIELLNGKRIGITGTPKTTEKLQKEVEKLKGKAVNLSFSKVCEFQENAELIKALKHLNQYSWIVFTSPNGVELFFKQIKSSLIDYRHFANVKFAVVGDGTAETLKNNGFIADYKPNKFTTKSLGEGLSDIVLPNETVLLLRAEDASEELTDILDVKKINYREIKTYYLSKDFEKRSELLKEVNSLDYLIFLSKSGVDGFFENLEPKYLNLIKDTEIICIGEITAKTLEKYKIKNYIMPKKYCVSGIIELLKEKECINNE